MKYSEPLGREQEDAVVVVEDFAYQVGLPEILLGLAALALIGFGIWKVASLLWAAFWG